MRRRIEKFRFFNFLANRSVKVEHLATVRIPGRIILKISKMVLDASLLNA